MVHYKNKPDSWLYSDSILRRSFAIWGHFMIAHMVVMVIVWVTIAIAALAFFSTFAAIGSSMNDLHKEKSTFQNSNEYDDTLRLESEL